jgi:hypothetical protein
MSLTRAEAFDRLATNLFQFIRDKGIAVEKPSTEDLVAVFASYVKGRPLDQLEQFYSNHPQFACFAGLSAEDKARVRRFVAAMVELI